jgi:hypothetical protein
MKYILILSTFLTFSGEIFGNIYTWTFSGSTWSTPDNWSPFGVPGPLDTAVFPQFPSPIVANIDLDVMVKQLTIGQNVELNASLFNITVSNNALNSGTITLSAATSLYIGGNYVFSGSIDDGTVTIVGNVTMNNGNFTPRDAAINGDFSWSHGTIGRSNESGTYTVGGMFAILPNSSVHALTKKHLYCNGGVSWQGGFIQLLNSAVWEIPTGQTCTITGGTDVSGTGTLQLYGTMMKNYSGLITWATNFNNNGTVEINEGTLLLSGPLNTYTGAFSVPNGSILRLENGTHNFNGVTFSGQGTVNWTASGTFNLLTVITVPNLIMNYGILNGNYNLTVQGDYTVGVNANIQNVGDITVTGAFNWTGGQIGYLNQAPGTITVAGLTTFSSSAGKSLHSKTLVMNGGGEWTGGVIELRYGALVQNSSGQTFKSNLGTGSSTIDGTIGSGSFTNLGTFNKIGTGTANINAIFDNQGTINIQNGALDPDGWTFTHSGILKGNGSLLGSVLNNGIIAPGQSPGTLTMQGSLTSNANSDYQFELSYNGSTVTKDSLSISGSAALAGTLDISILSATLPAGTYVLISNTGTLSGSFATVNFPSVCNGNCSISYGPHTVSLVASIALPIELLDFSVHKQGREVNVQWSTGNENKSYGFELQRSVDLLSRQDIHFEAGNGTTSERHSYQFVDPTPNKGINYYRLKLLDMDGNFAYSGIQSVQFDQNLILIAPNPSAGTLNLSFQYSIDALKIKDINGNVVKCINTETRDFALDISDLPVGIYFMEICFGSQVRVEKIIKI